MNIQISDKAKNYLNKKEAKELTVDLVIAGAEINIGEPNVTVGKPKHLHEKYDTFEVDGYTVYFFEHPETMDENIEIDTKKFLGMESLSVKGIKII